MLDARHLNSNTNQSSESRPLEILATQPVGVSRKYKSAIDLLYAYPYATLHDETIKLTGLSTVDTLFAFVRGFYGLKVLRKFFIQQMSLLLKDLICQGTALV